MSGTASRSVRRGTLIAGLGSPHGDDRAGWEVIDCLRARLGTSDGTAKVRDGTELLELLGGVSALRLIDASEPCGAPGSVRVYRWPWDEEAAVLPRSSHGVGLSETLALADALGLLPAEVYLYAIEAGHTDAVGEMSSTVADSVAAVANELRHIAHGDGA